MLSLLVLDSCTCCRYLTTDENAELIKLFSNPMLGVCATPLDNDQLLILVTKLTLLTFQRQWIIKSAQFGVFAPQVLATARGANIAVL
jgi:hypothetical protein